MMIADVPVIDAVTHGYNWGPWQLVEHGSFLSFGAEDRIVWATGGMAVHSRPLIEAFWEFQIPPEMQHGFGLPELTLEIKRKILGGNAARMLGIDLNERMMQISSDEFSKRDQLAPPWSRVIAGSASPV